MFDCPGSNREELFEKVVYHLFIPKKLCFSKFPLNCRGFQQEALLLCCKALVIKKTTRDHRSSAQEADYILFRFTVRRPPTATSQFYLYSAQLSQGTFLIEPVLSLLFNNIIYRDKTIPNMSEHLATVPRKSFLLTGGKRTRNVVV